MEKFSTWILGTSMLFLASCQSHMAVLQQDKHESSVAYHEVRAELADLKHAVSNAQVEIQILEERLQKPRGFNPKDENRPCFLFFGQQSLIFGKTSFCDRTNSRQNPSRSQAALIPCQSNELLLTAI